MLFITVSHSACRGHEMTVVAILIFVGAVCVYFANNYFSSDLRQLLEVVRITKKKDKSISDVDQHFTTLQVKRGYHRLEGKGIEARGMAIKITLCVADVSENGSVLIVPKKIGIKDRIADIEYQVSGCCDIIPELASQLTRHKWYDLNGYIARVDSDYSTFHLDPCTFGGLNCKARLSTNL